MLCVRNLRYLIRVFPFGQFYFLIFSVVLALVVSSHGRVGTVRWYQAQKYAQPFALLVEELCISLFRRMMICPNVFSWCLVCSVASQHSSLLHVYVICDSGLTFVRTRRPRCPRVMLQSNLSFCNRVKLIKTNLIYNFVPKLSIFRLI